ncbi:Uncharacterised protein [Yersinia frederiksenii]|nr:Uncharacterised protein [Yersinia frederiksenii]
MALSRCPKCESTRFEMVEKEVANARFKIMFIQCSSCGTVVGTTDYENTPSLLHKLATALGVKI